MNTSTNCIVHKCSTYAESSPGAWEASSPAVVAAEEELPLVRHCRYYHYYSAELLVPFLVGGACPVEQ